MFVIIFKVQTRVSYNLCLKMRYLSLLLEYNSIIYTFLLKEDDSQKQCIVGTIIISDYYLSI